MIPHATDERPRHPFERREARPTFEFVAFGSPHPEAVHDTLPLVPGAVRCSSNGHPMALYIAPATWLICAPDPDLTARIEALVEGCVGALINVEGKWEEFELRGADAARVLASAIDVETVLDARDCAAVTLFDCPSILARSPDGFTIWVRASYAGHFAAAADRGYHRPG